MAQGVNLATKYNAQLEDTFTKNSFVKPHTASDYDWDGTRTIVLTSAVTQPLHDYKRTGVWRYGDPQELENDQEPITLTKDKSFSMTIDRGNAKDALYLKNVGAIIKQQIAEQVVPFWDKLAITNWSTAAVALDGVTAPDKDTVVDLFIKARTQFVNDKIPMNEDCIAYVPSSTYALLLRNPDFISVDKLGEKVLSKGFVGKCMNWTIIEMPDDYFPANEYALFTCKKKVYLPEKISELFVRTDVPGISGNLIEGRYYGDAFAKKTIVNSMDPTNPEGEGTLSYKGIVKAAAATSL